MMGSTSPSLWSGLCECLTTEYGRNDVVQFPGRGLKKLAVSTFCLLEISFLKPCCHAVRKPKHLWEESYLEKSKKPAPTCQSHRWAILETDPLALVELSSWRGLLSLWPIWPFWEPMQRPWIFPGRLWLLNLGMKHGFISGQSPSPFIPVAVFVNTWAQNLEVSRGCLLVGKAVCHVQFTASPSCPVTLCGC